MQHLAIWLFGWLLDVLWSSILKPLLKATAKGFMVYSVVATFCNMVFDYALTFMQPFLLLAGNWWPALGGDVIVIITIFAIKFKMTLKIMQATVGQK